MNALSKARGLTPATGTLLTEGKAVGGTAAGGTRAELLPFVPSIENPMILEPRPEPEIDISRLTRRTLSLAIEHPVTGRDSSPCDLIGVLGPG